MNQITLAMLLLMCTILVSACGQYGDLYHPPPEQQDSEQATAEQQAETGETKDKEKQ